MQESGPNLFWADRPIAARSTAVLLLGFREEAPAGESDERIPSSVRTATATFLERVAVTETLILAASHVLVPSAADLVDSAGLPAAAMLQRALRGQCRGVLAADFQRFGSRIVELAEGSGLTAFSHTALGDLLAASEIRDVVIAGELSCVAIDATARAALQRGYRVTVLSDCTRGTTCSEYQLFFERVFPLYAEVATADRVARQLTAANRARS